MEFIWRVGKYEPNSLSLNPIVELVIITNIYNTDPPTPEQPFP